MDQPTTQRRGTILLLICVGSLSSFAVADENQQSIQSIYSANCADCHGDKGSAVGMRGDFPGIPDFQDLTWQLRRKNVQLRASIAMGMGDEMPAFEGDLGDEDIKALVTLIRSFSPEYAAKAAKPASMVHAKRKQPASGESFDERMEALETRWSRLLEEFKAVRQADRGK